MVKLIFLCRRRPDITHARYAELLLRGHVPIALRHHPTLRSYTVNIVERGPAEVAEIDSIGELSFDTIDDFRERLYDGPEGEAIVARDVAGFMGGADAYATTEHVQKAAAPRALAARAPGVKLFCPLRRRPDLSHAQFVEHWLGTHVPLALEHHPRLVRYVTDVVERRLSPTGEDWDGFAQLSFASAADAQAGLFSSPAGERAIRADMARFIGHTYAFSVAEYVQRE